MSSQAGTFCFNNSSYILFAEFEFLPLIDLVDADRVGVTLS